MFFSHQSSAPVTKALKFHALNFLGFSIHIYLRHQKTGAVNKHFTSTKIEFALAILCVELIELDFMFTVR